MRAAASTQTFGGSRCIRSYKVTALILLIALALPSPGQTPRQSASATDLSGRWRDDSGWIWTISQNGSEITIVSADGATTHLGLDGRVIKFTGALDGRVIKYIDWTVLGEASDDPSCQPYVGQRFEFPSQFKISKNADKIERRAPEGVSKGQCKLNLKRIPAFVLKRVRS